MSENSFTDEVHDQQRPLLSSASSNAGAKDRRASRACLACRARKSRCDLSVSSASGVPGEPPCRRCRQEQRECVLTVSRRGGRRVRKSLVTKSLDESSGQQSLPNAQGPRPAEDPLETPATRKPSDYRAPEILDKVQQSHNSNGLHWEAQPEAQIRSHSQSSLQPPPPLAQAHSQLIPADSIAVADNAGTRRHTVEVLSTSEGWNVQDWDGNGVLRTPKPAQAQRHPTHSPDDNLEGHITSADLINPSDALDLLAQVAERSGEETRSNNQPSSEGYGKPNSSAGEATMSNDAAQPEHEGESPDYPPISEGQVTVVETRRLLKIYQEKYHRFFPVAHSAIFDDNVDIAVLAREEPFLLSAVLTIAAKNEPGAAKAFAACSAHTESLISNLIYMGSASVGAVEALLILAEWPPQRLNSRRSIGRGEEDHGAWMQVGCAIRLGYLQGLEQTGLYPGKKTGSKNANRKRLAWAACYMSDRQISIRLGKGFWSRGPGPSTILNAADFPTLKPMSSGQDDLSMLFKAHLELTQLFSNAHDILYSSSMHREHLYAGGEYVRYIDDFASMLRSWKLVWGSLSFSPHVKATLVLSYDYLRLYIHAFAFQAELYRRAKRESATSHPRGTGTVKSGPLFTNVATSPDARFIYESIDAANSLLSTLNSFIDPVAGLRYMPLKYYLYIIYAAVFLFKARLAEAITADGEDGVRRTIAATVERLQRSAINRESPGYRYARLVYQLWLKPRSRGSTSSGTATGLGAPNGTGARHGTSVANTLLAAARSRRSSFTNRPSANGLAVQSSPSHEHRSQSLANQNQFQHGNAATVGQRSGVATDGGAIDHDSARAPPSIASPNIIDFDAVMNDFSWRDLNAVGEFITNDTSTAESVHLSPDFAGGSAYGGGGGAAGGMGTGIGDPQVGTTTMAVDGVDDWIGSWMGTDVIF